MLTLTQNTIFQRRPDDEQRELGHRTTLTRTSAKRQLVSALQSKNAVAEIETLPGFEESLHIICRGNFPLWSIVPAMLELTAPCTIEALSIATLGFSKQNAGELMELLDAGKVKAVSVVCSVYFERQNPSEFRMMADGLAERGQRLMALRAHAKILTFALSDGRRFAVESSANLRSCRNLEQITLTQSPPLHDFHAGWINEVITTAQAADKRGK